MDSIADPGTQSAVGVVCEPGYICSTDGIDDLCRIRLG